MTGYIHQAVFGVYPYVALSIFAIGSLVRFDTDQYGWRSKSSQLLRRKQLILGSVLFHVGILGILLGHGVGLLTPVALFEFLGISHGFKQMMAIVVGGICGTACFIGLAMLLHRRLFDSRIRKTSSFSDIAVLLLLFAQLSLGMLTIPLSLGHLDGAMMVKFMNYVQGIVTLRPQPSLIADVPLIFKLHMFLGFTIFLVFPFTRLVHVWSAPVGYLFRNYQVVRTKLRPAAVAVEDDLPPYVFRPVLRSQPVRRKEAA
jgi:nitrate reductase gamma subunit